MISHQTEGYIQHVAATPSNVLPRDLTQVPNASSNASWPTPAQNEGCATPTSTSLCLAYLRLGVPFHLRRGSGAHTGRCSTSGGRARCFERDACNRTGQVGQHMYLVCACISARLSSAIAEASLAQLAEHPLNKREVAHLFIPQEASCTTTPEQVLHSSLARVHREGQDP